MRELLTSRGEAALIELVRVDSDHDARARSFLGSPTVRIDGTDIEPGAAERTDYGLKCRLYRTAAGLAGMPDDAPLVAALERAADTHKAQAALARLGLTAPRRARAAALDSAHRQLYERILASFAAGARPSADDVRAWSGELVLNAAAALETLRSADLVQADPGGAVAVAYPFSAGPTSHRVTLDRGPALWAMCAIDALAIPFMLQRRLSLPVHQLLRIAGARQALLRRSSGAHGRHAPVGAGGRHGPPSLRRASRPRPGARLTS